jgi:hypothetical protein
LIKIVQKAGSLIPDAPITHDNGLNNFTNKPDIDRVMALYEVADLWAAAGNSANAIELAHNIGTAGYNQSQSLKQIVAAQAGAGYLADAIKTAASWYDVNDSETAQLNIAAAQAKAGDLAAASATLTAAQRTAAGVQSAYMRNSQLGEIAEAQAKNGDIPGAQRTAELIPSPKSRSLAEIAIAQAQADAGDLAGAQASLLVAQQGANLWTSFTVAQKTATCECALDPHENLAHLERLIGDAQVKAGNIAGARTAFLIAQREVAADAGDKWSTAFDIAFSQVKVGDISGALATAKLISEPYWQSSAAHTIAVAQAKAGDVAGARTTAELITDVPHKVDADSEIAEAAAPSASDSPPSAPQPGATPRPRAAPPPPPAVSLADWIGELDRLNTPLFLDLAEALKTPQATYKAIYTGSSGFDDSNNDPKKIFKALVTLAGVVTSAKSTIDQMLEQQARQRTHP